jgi:hypothetical protein
MFSLTEIIQLNNSLVFFLFFTSRSASTNRLVWYELALETRKKSRSIIESYETFCLLTNLMIWSASNQMLEKWIIDKLMRSLLLKQKKIKLDTIVSYLIELRSRHIDHRLSLHVFENSRLRLMIKENKRIFSQTKRVRLLIIKEILTKIIILISFESRDDITISIASRDNFNVNIVFKIAWVEFLRLDEIIYMRIDRKKILFDRLNSTRENISFVENDQYAILRLKRNKIDLNYTRVQIMLIVINESTCLVLVLRHLFTIDSQSSDVFLFRLKFVFIRSSIIETLRKRLMIVEINEFNYFEHSFRRKAT